MLRWIGWEALLLPLVTALIYRPSEAPALPVLDFSEFLPRLAAHHSGATQFLALASYFTGQGRFDPLQWLHVVIAWNLFGTGAPGWSWTYYVFNVTALLLGYALFVRLGIRRGIALAVILTFALSPAMQGTWWRPTGEPIGLSLLLVAAHLGIGYTEASNWRARTAFIAGCMVGALLAKEPLVALVPVVWLFSRLTRSGARYIWARWRRRDSLLASAIFIAVTAVEAVTAYVALHAPPGGYGARYGKPPVSEFAIVTRFDAAMLPTLGGIHGIWDAVRYPNAAAIAGSVPSAIWIILIAFGAIMGARRERRVWIPLIGLLWSAAGVIVYLPWPIFAPFYMMPFAFGGAMLAAYSLSTLIDCGPAEAQWVSHTVVAGVLLLGTLQTRDALERNYVPIRVDAQVAKLLADAGVIDSLLATVPQPRTERWALGRAGTMAAYAAVTDGARTGLAHDVKCGATGDRIELPAGLVVLNYPNGCGRLRGRSVSVSARATSRAWPLYALDTIEATTYVAGILRMPAVRSGAPGARALPSSSATRNTNTKR